MTESNFPELSSGQKRVLILTSDAGFGHRRSAESVEKALLKLYGDQVQVEVVNPITDTDKALLMKNVEKNYNIGVKNTPGLYRLGYQLSDNRQVSDMMDGALTLALTSSLKEVIKSFKPQAILNTNEMFNSAVGSALDQLDMHMPYFTVVTDFADVHALWFSNEPDFYFLASDWVRVRALENEMKPEKLIVSGIPVDPIYEEPLNSKVRLRKKLRIEPNLPTFLIVGGERVKNVLETVEALEHLEHDFQVVAIAGGNDRLFLDLVKLKPKFPLHVHHFLSNMPDWLRAADVLITKAGGLILSEGLAAGLPILIIHYLPGQEEGNVRYVLSHQAAAMPANTGEAIATLDYWLKDDAKGLKITAQAAKLLGKPHAASQVAEALWKSINDPAKQATETTANSNTH
jgi:1,2-diacylglycerol 3-beta-galactosyltransferase